MKSPYLLFALLLCRFFSKAQTDFRFADSTAVWHQGVEVIVESVYAPSWSEYSTSIFEIGNDTFFNNFYYQKIIQRNNLAAFIRRDSSEKIFVYNPWGEQEDKLIYDFSLGQGDTFKIIRNLGSGDTTYQIADSVDMVTYGTPRKRLFVKYHDKDYVSEADIWIEGIGSITSDFLDPATQHCIPGCFYNLLCFTEKGITYNFSSSCFVGVEDVSYDFNFLTILPNPASTQLHVKLGDASNSLKTIQLYSVTGREVLNLHASGQAAVLNTSQIAAGVYLCRVRLEDGKFVVRKVVIE